VSRGLTTWFQPTISVQRDLATAGELGDDPVILPGDLLHCDVGIVALGLHTDTQHNAYVLRPGETEPPAGLQAALARSNRLQDLLFEEIRPGRTGNDVLFATLARMRTDGLDGTIYTHPIGLHGHGAGPLIGLWDRQDGVPGRGDHRVRAGTWFSSELQVTSTVPEWGNQRVRMAQEEDFLLGADGVPRWFHRRQSRLHVVR
jgi:Xaa-Pro aminopeptidase